MNDVVTESLNTITAGELVGWIFAIIAVISAIVGLSIKIYKLVEKYRILRNAEETKDNKINEHETEINDINVELTEIKSSVNSISDKVSVLSTMLLEMQSSNNSKERAKLKDKIRQSYSYYTKTQKWNKMEKEALEGLIASYEESGGDNSFVHAIVVQEMYNWELID